MKKNRIIQITVIVLILLAVGVVVALFMTGKLVWSNTTRQVSTHVVCGSDVVNKYNDAMYYVIRPGSDVPTLDTEGIKTINEDIKKKDGYKDDPTCQTLLFWIAIHNNDYTAGNEAYLAVKGMHDKGIYADSNIRGNDALFTWEGVLFPISPDAANKQEGDQ